MRWGMHDKLGLNFDAYRENLENVRYIVPELLKMFTERNIRATWACVGALGCHNWDEYFERAPKPPKYDNPLLAVNPKYAELDPYGHLHFAPDLLSLICKFPGQELGTHTFSHIYMREPGITREDVLADLCAVSSLWSERFGANPVSLVFPRNQNAFIEDILSTSIKIWRSNEKSWYQNCNETATNKWLARSLRMLEAVNPFVRRASKISADSTRSSLFLRPNLPWPAWHLHRKRVSCELNSLKAGEIFHVWWHPHNLGSDMRLRISRTEEILDLIGEKVSKGCVSSNCMSDLIPVTI